MKNKKIIIFSILLVGLICLSVQSGWCVDAVQNAVQNTAALPADIPMKTDSMKSVFMKFALTMVGVLVSLFVIWAGLNIFKKFTTKLPKEKTDRPTSDLDSPKTTDEAIVFFINKNRLK